MKARRHRSSLLGLVAVLAAAAVPTLVTSPAGAAPGGVLDPTFGIGGRAGVSVPGVVTVPRAVVTAVDGSVLVTGHAGDDVLLAHLDAAGRPIGAFDGASIVTTDVPGAGSGLAVAVARDGRVVVAGSSDTDPGGLLALRYQRDGRLDQSLGTGGLVSEPADPEGAFNVQAIAVQPDGKVLVGGFFGPLADKSVDRDRVGASVVTVAQMAVVRLLADGSRDPGFGTDGMVRVAFAGPADVRALALQPDGKILFGGSAVVGNEIFVVVRVTANGDLDGTFGSGGTASATFTGASAGIDALALAPDGSVLAAGPIAPSGAAGTGAVAVARFRPGGTLDPAFSGDGEVVTVPSTSVAGTATAVALGIRPDGQVVVGASTAEGFTTVGAYQLRPDGTPDPGFGTAGALTQAIDPFDRVSSIQAMAVQPDGRIVAVGVSTQLHTVPMSAAFAMRLTTSPLVTADRQGYWMLDASGRVYAFGDATYLGDPFPAVQAAGTTAVDLAPTATGDGYWVVDSAGHVYAFGDATRYGDVSFAGRPTVSLAAKGDGYIGFAGDLTATAWTSTGSTTTSPGFPLNQPVVDAVPGPGATGGTYAVAADGGVFSLGGAPFLGSMGGVALNQPVTGMATDPDGRGYWLVAADGGIFAFDAPFLGSMGGVPLNQPVTDMVPWADGYLLVAADGGIFTFGHGPFAGSLGDAPPVTPVVAVAAI
jgi:uncharacterized delta-60 repeat protein